MQAMIQQRRKELANERTTTSKAATILQTNICQLIHHVQKQVQGSVMSSVPTYPILAKNSVTQPRNKISKIPFCKFLTLI